MALSRLVTMTAVAVALVASAAPVFAQSATVPSTSPPAASTAPRAAAPAATVTTTATAPAARHMRDNEMRASKVIGSSVYDTSDTKIGNIADLIVDRDGKVSDVVLGVGGFLGAGEKNVAVKVSDLKRGKDHRFVLNTTKDALKQMTSYDLNHDMAARSGSSLHK